MDTITIGYCITTASGMREVFDLHLDARTLALVNATPADPPSWTVLGFHQCPHCTLSAATHTHCPFALRLVDVVRGFKGLTSYDHVHLVVTTQERTVSQETTAQRAVSSLIGLICAASGCPQTRFFRPMARFHLPLASGEETIYRAASMYLLAQYFQHQAGTPPDMLLTGLKQIYADTGVVNHAMVRRLREDSDTDSALNGIILLDMFVKTMPYVIEDSLEKIRYLFDPYFP